MMRITISWGWVLAPIWALETVISFHAIWTMFSSFMQSGEQFGTFVRNLWNLILGRDSNLGEAKNQVNIR